MKIDVKGVIVSNDDKPIYDLFDMESTSPNVVTEALNKADGDDVEVTINSGGGDLFAGSHIFSELKDYEGNVEVKITGVAASSASIIAMGADSVKMSPTASLMVHNVSMVAAGNSNDFQHASNTLKTLNKTVANAYMEKTGMSQEDLLNMMDDETWLDADTAYKNGFIDEILFRQDKYAAATENMIPDKVIEGVRNTLMKQRLRNEDDIPEQDDPRKEEEGSEGLSSKQKSEVREIVKEEVKKLAEDNEKGKTENRFRNEDEETDESNGDKNGLSDKQKDEVRNIVKEEIKKQIDKDEPEETPDNSIVVNGVKYVAQGTKKPKNKFKRWI